MSVAETEASSGFGAISATIVKKMAGTMPLDRPKTIAQSVKLPAVTV